MSFGQAVSAFFSNYANFRGRTRRSGYWWAALFLVLASIVLWFVDLQLFAGMWPQGVAGKRVGPLINSVWSRDHRPGSVARRAPTPRPPVRSGWWVLLGFIPLIGSIVLLVFYVQDSQTGENAYGPNPKEAESPTV